VNKYDPVAKHFWVPLKLLAHTIEGFTGVDRIQKNALGAGHLADKRKLLGTRLAITASHIAVDYLDITLTRKREVKLVGIYCGLANISNHPEKIIPIVTDIYSHNPSVQPQQFNPQYETGGGPP
jgi:hypothetical protein